MFEWATLAAADNDCGNMVSKLQEVMLAMLDISQPSVTAFHCDTHLVIEPLEPLLNFQHSTQIYLTAMAKVVCSKTSCVDH